MKTISIESSKLSIIDFLLYVGLEDDLSSEKGREYTISVRRSRMGAKRGSPYRITIASSWRVTVYTGYTGLKGEDEATSRRLVGEAIQ